MALKYRRAYTVILVSDALIIKLIQDQFSLTEFVVCDASLFSLTFTFSNFVSSSLTLNILS